MKNLEDRIAALERAITVPPQWVIFVDDRPTPEQAAQIDQAEREGRSLIVLVARGNTAYMTGCGKPFPWDLDLPTLPGRASDD